MFLRNGEVRAADHHVIHDVYLAKVKNKDQVKEDWDYEEIVKTIPAAEAFGPAGRPPARWADAATRARGMPPARPERAAYLLVPAPKPRSLAPHRPREAA